MLLTQLFLILKINLLLLLFYKTHQPKMPVRTIFKSNKLFLDFFRTTSRRPSLSFLMVMFLSMLLMIGFTRQGIVLSSSKVTAREARDAPMRTARQNYENSLADSIRPRFATVSRKALA